MQGDAAGEDRAATIGKRGKTVGRTFKKMRSTLYGHPKHGRRRGGEDGAATIGERG